MPGVGPGQCEEAGAGPAPGQVDTGEPGDRGPGADPLQVTSTDTRGVTLSYAGSYSHRKGETVCSLCSDDWVLVVGMTDGLAKVYSIDTLAFITLLNCRHDQ